MRKQTLKNRNIRGQAWIDRITAAISREWKSQDDSELLLKEFNQTLNDHDDTLQILLECSLLLMQEKEQLTWITQRELDREDRR